MTITIDEQILSEGNAAFESIGLSPSDVIQALWAFAARNKDNPEKLRAVFQSLLQR